MTFKRYLKRLQKQHYPSVKAFAAALGHNDPSRISRGTPFDVRACLRLAKVTGESPSVVLRAAGKADIAEAIEDLYGAPRTPLPADQRQLLEWLAAIQDRTTRTAIFEVARAAALAAAHHPNTTPADDSGTDQALHHHRRMGDAR